MNSVLRLWFTLSWLCALMFLANAASAQDWDASVRQTSSRAMLPSDTQNPTRAYPRVAINGDRKLEYVGAFSAEGRFKRPSKFDRAVDALITASVPYNATAADHHLAVASVPNDADSSSAALGVALRARARVVPDVEPPGRALMRVEAHSLLGEIHDVVSRLVAGTERIVFSPHALTTDSRQRVIVSDPSTRAVHVLDHEGKDSFHIFGGLGRRLRYPQGIAVDSNDNIYVADAERGMVLVYDRDGRFLRYIGNFNGENMYERPTGLAIDRKSGILYLLDTARHALFMLDLQGRLLAKFGTRGGGKGPSQFFWPTRIVAGENELAVLDSGGSRIQLFDLQGHFQKQFSIRAEDPRSLKSFRRPVDVPGICVDSEGYIYVSDSERGSVRVYNQEGQLISTFGRRGRRMGEFQAVGGMWADAYGRLYIGDASNLAVQIFQFQSARAETASVHSAPERYE